MEKIKDLKLSIPFKWVAVTAYAILIVPILLFFIGWLKWYLAILFSVILLFGAYWVIKKDYLRNKDNIEMPVGILIGALIAFSLWIFISGSCYTSVPGVDIVWRNTSLKDLVNYDWPVYYPEKNGYLCFYFLFWMVPALIGKIFGMNAAWIALGAWFLLILITVFLLISYFFKDYRKSSLKIIIVFMIMWSGINILGMFLVSKLGLEPLSVGWNLNEHYCDYFWVDGEAFNFYYRSNEDFFTECYNQLPIWIVTPLMLQNRKIHNYAFLGLILFPFSPWGTAGIALMMAADAVYYIRKRSFKSFIKEAFSIPNLCAIFSVFAVFMPFISQAGGFVGEGNGLRLLPINKMTFQMWLGTIIFWLCEFGIYYIFTWKKYKKDHLFKAMLLFLAIIPFFHIGPKGGRDVCLDVPLPELYALMIYMIGYVKDDVFTKDKSFFENLKPKNCLLIVVLGLSFTTPVFDWISKVNVMNAYQSISLQDKSIESFADCLGYNGGWGTPISKDVDDTSFFKNMCKTVDKENAKWLPISDELADIRNIDDISEYFDYLAGKDCTVFIAIKDIPGFNLTQDIIDKVKKLGFDDSIDVLALKEYHSFIGVVNSGQIIHQQVGGDEYISYYGEGVINGDNVWMESSTWTKGNYAVINIKNGYYCMNVRGLNVVVKDNAADRIIDSVAFDAHYDMGTYTEKITCYRKNL